LSADGNTIVFWPFWSSCIHKCMPLRGVRFLWMQASDDDPIFFLYLPQLMMSKWLFTAKLVMDVHTCIL
jgi:hypothetical protein